MHSAHESGPFVDAFVFYWLVDELDDDKGVIDDPNSIVLKF